MTTPAPQETAEDRAEREQAGRERATALGQARLRAAQRVAEAALAKADL
jgi:hypothetical protein